MQFGVRGGEEHGSGLQNGLRFVLAADLRTQKRHKKAVHGIVCSIHQNKFIPKTKK